MSDHTEQIVNTLMREYELHKQELLLQIQLYNRQTQYIQLYGVFLLGLLTFLFSAYPEWSKGLFNELIKRLNASGVSISEDIVRTVTVQSYPLPPCIILILLILAAFIAFYFVSAVMASSYMFLIIRRRMAQIEQEINNLLSAPNILAYETYIASHFLEKTRYGGGLTFTPHFLSGVWRVIIFACIIIILCYSAYSFLPASFSLPYIIMISILALSQGALYLWLNTKGKKNFDIYYSHPFEIQKHNSQKSLFANFLIVILVLIVMVFSIDFLRSIYLMFVSYETFQIKHGLTLLYIFVYEIACAIFWPTPSEVPLLLYPKFPLFTIIIVSAIGKSFGAYLFFKWWPIINKLIQPVIQYIQRLITTIIQRLHLNHIIDPIKNYIKKRNNKIKHFIETKGFIAYFLMQAIPFMPMRSSIYVYSFISRNGAKVAIGAAIGTIFRNLLMLLLIWFGYISVKTLFLK